MKKIITLFALLCLAITGWAQQVTTISDAGTPLTLTQLTELSGTGGHVAFASLGASPWTNKWLANPNDQSNLTLSTVQLYAISNGSVAGKYYMQRASDSQYRTTSGWGDSSSAENIEFKTYSGNTTVSCNNKISIHNNSGTQWNINAGGFGGMLNGWAAYAAYGPFYIASVEYLDEDDKPLQDPTIYIVKQNTTINFEAPTIVGYVAKTNNPASISVTNADAVAKVYYEAAPSYDYNVEITGDVPSGTVVKIKGNEVSNGSPVSYSEAVTENDVVVIFPTGYEYMAANVTIGNTIIVNCYDPRWPINFDKSTKSTHASRYTNMVGIDDSRITWTSQKNDYIYRDMTAETITVLVGKTVTPYIGYRGWAMYGYLYIDYNNDGDFTDDGELVSQMTGNNWTPGSTADKTIPDFTVTSTPGTYRARFKVEWNDTNPGGNATMAKDGGSITDVMINVISYHDYLGLAIADANNEYNTLNTGATTVAIGYPTSAALATYNQAISDAQAVYEANAGGEADAVTALETATTTVKSVASTNYTPRTDVYYTITSARGSMIYHPDYVATGKEDISFLFHTGSTKNNGALNVALDATNPNHQWGFILYEGKYYMYNVGKRQFANVTQNGSYQGDNGDKHTWMFSEAPSAVTLDAGEGDWVATPNVRVRATSEVTGLQYAMSISQSYDGPVIAYDAVNDGGIPMTFAVATTTQDATVTAAIEALLEDLTPYRDALQDAIDAADALKAAFGTGLNQYSVTGGEDAFNTALADAKTEVAKADIETSKADLITAREALETAQAGLTKSINQPTAGFYRIKGLSSGNYLAEGLVSVDNTNKFTMSDAENATTIFYYDGTKLTNFKTGMCNGMNKDKWEWVVGTNASTVTFEDGDTNGGYAIKSTNAYFYDNGTNADRGSSLGSNERYRNWYLTEVTTLPVTISAAGYATLYAPVALTIPNDVDVYTGSNEGTYLHLDAITGQTIPANTGVVLARNAGTYNFEITDNVIGIDTDLEGAIASFTIPSDDTYYTLRANSDGTEPGFYIKDAGKTIQGFRAYLKVSGSSPIRAFMFAGTTGITTFDANCVTNGKAYDLQGRRVNTPKNGFYIVNGKKVIL